MVTQAVLIRRFIRASKTNIDASNKIHNGVYLDISVCDKVFTLRKSVVLPFHVTHHI